MRAFMIAWLVGVVACSSASPAEERREAVRGPTLERDLGGEAPEDAPPEPTPPPASSGVPLAAGESLAPFGAPATYRWEDAEGGPLTLAWVVRPHGNGRKLFLVGVRGTERIELGEGPELSEGQPCPTTSATFVRNGPNVVAVVGRDETSSAADAAECPRWRTNTLLVLRAGAPVAAERFDGFPDEAGHGPAWLYENGRPTASSLRLAVHLRLETMGEDENGTPRARVSLVTEQLPGGTPVSREIGVYLGGCSFVDPPEVRGAVLHVRCWHAGAGDEVALVRRGNRLVVRHGESDEMTPRTVWREVSRVDLPTGAELETFGIR